MSVLIYPCEYNITNTNYSNQKSTLILMNEIFDSLNPYGLVSIPSDLMRSYISLQLIL